MRATSHWRRNLGDLFVAGVTKTVVHLTVCPNWRLMPATSSTLEQVFLRVGVVVPSYAPRALLSMSSRIVIWRCHRGIRTIRRAAIAQIPKINNVARLQLRAGRWMETFVPCKRETSQPDN
jgi:hypothetical protein